MALSTKNALKGDCQCQLMSALTEFSTFVAFNTIVDQLIVDYTMLILDSNIGSNKEKKCS